ncbi:MAG: type II secretion system minor pseudopilin GspI [Deltaproteobacteria bacterium]|nr:type II secretion system minor pseudopilin GspI [Deltaproteobacteria bacterium]
MKDNFSATKNKYHGFTLLEVMVAMAIIAIALTAVLGSQSQGVSLASEAKFNTTAALLAQSKMAEIRLKNPDELISDSGDFGEDFPGYLWQVTLSSVNLDNIEDITDDFAQIDLEISWGEDELYKYRLRELLFVPKSD